MSAVLDTTDVHIGHWINWSFGTIRGSTITLGRHDGALLTAFLALFVSFTGTRIWKIAAFTIYLSLVKDSPQDAIFHQRQAVLRNASLPGKAFWDLLWITWAWRKSESKRAAFLRVGPLAVVTLIAGAAFSVAGIFSAQVSSAGGNEVLLTGKHCAQLSSNWTTEDHFGLLFPYEAALIQAGAQRSQQCYTSNASAENCPTYVKPQLPLLINQDAPCPFDSKICQSDKSNLILDTGYLDSHNDLGINAPPSERIKFRQLTHCAPLHTDGYSSVVDVAATPNGTSWTAGPTNQQWMQFNFGNISATDVLNFTYQYPLTNPSSKAEYIGGTTNFNADYVVTVKVANYNNTNPDNENFEAIPELMRTDADTELYFLSANSVVFSQPVEDPWYSANRGPFTIGSTGSGNATGNFQIWFADNPANVVGCAPQFQFCNGNSPDGQNCSSMTSLTALIDELSTGTAGILAPWQNDGQMQTFANFMSILWYLSFTSESIVANQGAAALAARRSYLNGLSGGLPANQWQLDMEYLFATQLATVQRAFVEHANGPSYPGLESHLIPPNNPVQLKACTNQKIVTTNYTSFSTLGLVLTFAIGGFFIVISYLMEYVSFFIQRKRGWNTYRLTDWCLNGTLQLQSIAHEELGIGSWTREPGTLTGRVPTTLPGERLAVLDLKEPRHPRFKEAADSPLSQSSSKTNVVYVEKVGSKAGVEYNEGIAPETRSETSADSPTSMLSRNSSDYGSEIKILSSSPDTPASSPTSSENDSAVSSLKGVEAISREMA